MARNSSKVLPKLHPQPAVFSMSTVTAPVKPSAAWHNPSAHVEIASSTVCPL
jgi:hypothetical protein